MITYIELSYFSITSASFIKVIKQLSSSPLLFLSNTKSFKITRSSCKFINMITYIELSYFSITFASFIKVVKQLSSSPLLFLSNPKSFYIHHNIILILIIEHHITSHPMADHACLIGER